MAGRGVSDRAPLHPDRDQTAGRSLDYRCWTSGSTSLLSVSGATHVWSGEQPLESGLGSATPNRSCRRRSGRGDHQFALPSSPISAGTSSPRTANASIRTATAAPMPSSLRNTSWLVTNAPSATARRIAAAVTIAPAQSSNAFEALKLPGAGPPITPTTANNSPPSTATRRGREHDTIAKRPSTVTSRVRPDTGAHSTQQPDRGGSIGRQRPNRAWPARGDREQHATKLRLSVVGFVVNHDRRVLHAANVSAGGRSRIGPRAPVGVQPQSETTAATDALAQG
jgi:hypothetical protein